MLKEINSLQVDFEKLSSKISEIKKISCLKSYLGDYFSENGSNMEKEIEILSDMKPYEQILLLRI
jgi:hypothetical protein